MRYLHQLRMAWGIFLVLALWAMLAGCSSGKTTPGAENCANRIDDDGDGVVDCLDSDCRENALCQGNAEICGDGLDNDFDGKVDCLDTDCQAQPACSEICGNGIDDNADMLKDCDDPLCRGKDPACGEVCGDGTDNDGDSLVDCKDPDCAEVIPPCGAGSGPDGTMCAYGGVESHVCACADGKDNDNDGAEVAMTADPDAPVVAMAFKLVEESFGQLTYTRVYQGRVRKGQTLRNTRSRKNVRIGRMVRMHANEREDVDEAGAGDIVAFIGVDCATGDTFCDDKLNYALESIHAPEPVISLAITPAKGNDRDKLAKALSRFVREDPTFHVRTDPESGETVIAGVGELQLEVYVERIRREYGCEVVTSAPRVNYREAPTRAAEFNYKHKKQTGGSGQYGHVVGRLEPLPEGAEKDYEFENKITGARIPTEYIPSCDKGFQAARMKGPLAGYEVVRVKLILEDGSSHSVDSSDLAFQIAAREAFKEAYLAAKPAILEPIMKVEVEVPTEQQGGVVGDLTSRRGLIHGTELRGDVTVINAEVPLAAMFGYATDLRSMTQGRGTFAMEFAHYKVAPRDVQEEVIAKARAAAAAKR